MLKQYVKLFVPPELPIQSILRLTQILQESIESRNQKGILIPPAIFPIGFFTHNLHWTAVHSSSEKSVNLLYESNKNIFSWHLVLVIRIKLQKMGRE